MKRYKGFTLLANAAGNIECHYGKQLYPRLFRTMRDAKLWIDAEGWR